MRRRAADTRPAIEGYYNMVCMYIYIYICIWFRMFRDIIWFRDISIYIYREREREVLYRGNGKENGNYYSGFRAQG